MNDTKKAATKITNITEERIIAAIKVFKTLEKMAISVITAMINANTTIINEAILNPFLAPIILSYLKKINM